MVRGEKFFRRLYTSYEGDRVILDFSFYANRIIVLNDDRGIPWEGNWDDVGYIGSYTGGLKIEGPIIDGKDAAQLFFQLFVHQEMNLLEKIDDQQMSLLLLFRR